MATILVCDADQEFAQQVARIAGPSGDTQVLYLASLTDALRHVREGNASILVIGPAVHAQSALDGVEAARDAGCDACIVLVGDDVSRERLRQAMRAGVDDVVAAEHMATELEPVLSELLGKAERRGGAKAQAAEKRGQVVTVFSTKGGVGKTVVSTNLAVALTQAGNSVVLVDLDLQFGDVGIMLGLEPTRTIIGAVQSGERLDTELLSGFLLEHASGLKVLLAPVQPEDAEMVTASRIDRILSLLVSMFDYVIVDTPPTLDESVLTAIDRSDRVIAMTMMDVASVKNTKVSLQKLRQLGYDRVPVDVMLNRADSRVYLKPENVEQAIGCQIRYRLPSDQQIPRAVNKGVPVVIEAPKSAPAKVLMATAKTIMDEARGAEADVA